MKGLSGYFTILGIILNRSTRHWKTLDHYVCCSSVNLSKQSEILVFYFQQFSIPSYNATSPDSYLWIFLNPQASLTAYFPLSRRNCMRWVQGRSRVCQIAGHGNLRTETAANLHFEHLCNQVWTTSCLSHSYEQKSWVPLSFLPCNSAL